MALGFDPIAHDPVTLDRDYPATMASVTFDSHGALVNGVLLIAQGPGPHPTVLLLHGFPGNERNFDLAQVLRRARWNVMVFHYRGCWGSQGDYSFAHVLEDVDAALGFLRAARSQELFRVDTSGIVLVGHSMGGFAALLTASRDLQVRAVASISGANCAVLARALENQVTGYENINVMFEEAQSRLQGTTAEALVEEIIDAGEGWDLVRQAKVLVDRSVLLVAASRDEDLPVDLHHVPLAQALEVGGASDLTQALIDSDHSYNDKRIALVRTILAWLERQRPDVGG